MKTVVDKKQRFDIGRTINPFKCNCEKCDFLQCDNYAKKMKRVDNTVEEFVEQNKEALIASNYLIDTDDLLYAFFDAFGFGLGKGLYWDSRTEYDKEIRIVKFVNSQTATCYHISVNSSQCMDAFYNMVAGYGRITEGSSYFITAKAEAVAKRIANRLLRIKALGENKA